MSIDASVAYVMVNEDGSGCLHLCDRIQDGQATRSIAGQPLLFFSTAPHEVTALNGLNVWGGSGFLMLGETKIADRILYTRISFVERDLFLAAVAEYHRQRAPSQPDGTPEVQMSEPRVATCEKCDGLGVCVADALSAAPAYAPVVDAIVRALQLEADAAELMRGSRAILGRGHASLAQWEAAARTMAKAVRIAESFAPQRPASPDAAADGRS